MDHQECTMGGGGGVHEFDSRENKLVLNCFFIEHEVLFFWMGFSSGFFSVAV
jgi:hypothetical protein